MPEMLEETKTTRQRDVVLVLIATVHDDAEEEGLIAALSAFGKAAKAGEVLQRALAPTPTADRGRRGPTHDSYGNPYDPSDVGGTSHDAYGNPYQPTQTNRQGRR